MSGIDSSCPGCAVMEHVHPCFPGCADRTAGDASARASGQTLSPPTRWIGCTHLLLAPRSVQRGYCEACRIVKADPPERVMLAGGGTQTIACEVCGSGIHPSFAIAQPRPKDAPCLECGWRDYPGVLTDSHHPRCGSAVVPRDYVGITAHHDCARR